MFYEGSRFEFVRIPDDKGTGSSSGVKFTFTDSNGTETEVVMYAGQAYRMADAFIEASDKR